MTKDNPCVRCKELGFELPHPVWDDAGRCLFHSEREDKDKEGEFTKAVHQMIADGNCNFRGFFFPAGFSFIGDGPGKELKDADFHGAIFKGDANFACTPFRGDANFSGVRFSRKAFSLGARFLQGKADFIGVSFPKDAVFMKAIFEKGANFRQCTFRANANFNFSTFGGETDFTFARFEGAADFRGGRLPEYGQGNEYEIFSKEH